MPRGVDEALGLLRIVAWRLWLARHSDMVARRQDMSSPEADHLESNQPKYARKALDDVLVLLRRRAKSTAR